MCVLVSSGDREGTWEVAEHRPRHLIPEASHQHPMGPCTADLRGGDSPFPHTPLIQTEFLFN